MKKIYFELFLFVIFVCFTNICYSSINGIYFFFFFFFLKIFILFLGQWTLVSNNMTDPRIDHTATTLNNGKILVCGGVNNDDQSVSSCDLFDPTTKMFSFAGNMTTARYDHASVLLSSGKVFSLFLFLFYFYFYYFIFI